MRLDIQSRNRLGITQEVLAVFASHRIDVRKVDMFTHHTFVDVPMFDIVALPKVEADLLEIPGVTGVKPTDMLPSERRRAQLHAVISAMTDAVIAIGKDGTILLANRQANRMLGQPFEADLRGMTLASLVKPELVERVLASNFTIPEHEVEVGEDSYLIHTASFGLDSSDEESDQIRGGILIFQTRSRLGKIITALNRKEAEGFDAILGSSATICQVKDRARRLAGLMHPC